VIATPSKKVSRGASRLLASMKQNKDGCIEIKAHDQLAALMALGKITGALRDRTELSGAGGGPIALTAVKAPESLSNAELEAILTRGGGRVIEGRPALTAGGSSND
jgi:hypothetical protein